MTSTPPPDSRNDRRRELVVETLYKEFQRVQAKSAATDDWFFRFLSIAVVPFLVFLAYSLINPSYRIFVAALPALSLIGVLVVAVLTSHYLYANAYGGHLQRRINLVLGADVMTDLRYGPTAYSGFTPVTVSYAFGFLLLLALNVATVPLIDREVTAFHGRNAHDLGAANLVLQWYWEITLHAVAVVIVVASTAFVRTALRLSNLARDEKDDENFAGIVEPGAGSAVPRREPRRRTVAVVVAALLLLRCRGRK